MKRLNVSQDFYPTLMDIEMALERTLAYQHVLINPSVLKSHTSNPKAMSIPELIVSPYVIDLEAVIVGTVVEYTASVFGYSCSKTYVRVLRKKKKSYTQTAGRIIC